MHNFPTYATVYMKNDAFQCIFFLLIELVAPMDPAEGLLLFRPGANIDYVTMYRHALPKGLRDMATDPLLYAKFDTFAEDMERILKQKLKDKDVDNEIFRLFVQWVQDVLLGHFR